MPFFTPHVSSWSGVHKTTSSTRLIVIMATRQIFVVWRIFNDISRTIRYCPTLVSKTVKLRQVFFLNGKLALTMGGKGKTMSSYLLHLLHNGALPRLASTCRKNKKQAEVINMLLLAEKCKQAASKAVSHLDPRLAPPQKKRFGFGTFSSWASRLPFLSLYSQILCFF